MNFFDFLENSVVGDMGSTMYQDCCYDIKEIRRCADCYRISNEKSEKMWFCIPCDPPHQLVYAKQKGYPYWPAKVMQVTEEMYDVRFFGGHHMRANIEKVFIRPITASLQSLQVKKKNQHVYSTVAIAVYYLRQYSVTRIKKYSTCTAPSHRKRESGKK